MQTELLTLIAARNGHFRLESGHHGSLWLDLDPLFVRPGRLRRFVAGLADKLARHHIEAVCGPLTGGAFLAQSVAAALDVEFYYTQGVAPRERDALYAVTYRMPDGLHERAQGKSVAVVDDVINAGSAVRGTLAELRACGATPAAVGALLALGPAAAGLCADQHLPLETIAQLSNEIWAPAECPLCAAGTPLQDLTAEDRRPLAADGRRSGRLEE
jgi:orotate phosphoribosyltransferase